MDRPFQKPVLKPGEAFDRMIGIDDPAARYQAAHDTAWALLDHVRETRDPQLVQHVITLVEREGIDDVASLWSSSHEHSLPGLLWRLYLLHRVVTVSPEHASELFDHGSLTIGTIDPIVAGVREPISPGSVREMCDEILRGAFTGDFAIALERAASACQVLSTGAREIADMREIIDEQHGTTLTRQALRFSQIAEDFTRGARAWRAGAID